MYDTSQRLISFIWKEFNCWQYNGTKRTYSFTKLWQHNYQEDKNFENTLSNIIGKYVLIVM